jgi:hypothetical protein
MCLIGRHGDIARRMEAARRHEHGLGIAHGLARVYVIPEVRVGDSHVEEEKADDLAADDLAADFREEVMVLDRGEDADGVVD